MLYFIKHDEDNTERHCTDKIEDDNLHEYFGALGAYGEKILMVEIFKHNLRSKYLPKLFGLWHEFTVVRSTNWWWSFEKQSDAIYVQRSVEKATVRNRFKGKRRTGRVVYEGRDAEYGRIGDSIFHIFDWIYAKDEIHGGYHLTKSNCHYFASLLFEAIARQKDRALPTIPTIVPQPISQPESSIEDYIIAIIQTQSDEPT